MANNLLHYLGTQKSVSHVGIHPTSVRRIKKLQACQPHPDAREGHGVDPALRHLSLNYLKGGCIKVGVNLLSQLTNDWTRGSGDRLRQKRFGLKNVSIKRVIKH